MRNSICNPKFNRWLYKYKKTLLRRGRCSNITSNNDNGSDKILKTLYKKLVIDGMNIVYNKNKVSNNYIDFKKLNCTLKANSNYNIIAIVFNIKHKATIEKYYEQNTSQKENIRNVKFIYSPRNHNDDILTLYIWLSDINNNLLSNDNYHDHVKHIHNNNYLINMFRYLKALN